MANSGRGVSTTVWLSLTTSSQRHEGGRMRHAAVMATLLLMAAAIFGCQPAPDEAVDVPEPSPAPLVTMPDLAGKSVDQALETLSSSELPVLVEFPGYEAHRFEESKQIAGTTIPAHDETVAIGTRILSSAEIGGSRHEVETQTPVPGTRLSGVTTITILAGPHPNTTAEPWLIDGHTTVIKKNGATPCFDCHEETDCSNCHVEQAR